MFNKDFVELLCGLGTHGPVVWSCLLRRGGKVVSVLELLDCFGGVEVVGAGDGSLGVKASVHGKHGLELLDLGVGHAGDEGFGEEGGGEGLGGWCLFLCSVRWNGGASSSHGRELCAGEGADDAGAFAQACGRESVFCVFVLELDDGAGGGGAEVG